MKVSVVLTTINLNAPAIPVLERTCKSLGWDLVVVGDKKTTGKKPKDCHYLSPEDQKKLGYQSSGLIPWNNYARKNIGYIFAYKELGAEYVISTDDDNIPNQYWPMMVQYSKKTSPLKCANSIETNEKFFNFLPFFTPLGAGEIWPRGLPLQHVRTIPKTLPWDYKSNVGVVAGLWDGSPDFDAIGHSIFDGTDWKFRQGCALYNNCKSLSPYNTQNTLITRELLPFQYLSYGIGRANDIWTSYVSQFVMRQTGYSVVYTSPTVYQQRNEHSFNKDFEEEMLCYTKTEELVAALEKVEIKTDIVSYYLDLCEAMDSFIPGGNGVFHAGVRYWLKDLGVY